MSRHRRSRATAARRPSRLTRASEVTITQKDGTVAVLPAYRAAEFRAIVKERVPISATVKAAVRRRDRGTCRYCGAVGVPMEFDHVVPVCQGGSSQKRNIVLACEDCNRRKGGRVWTPRPLSA